MSKPLFFLSRERRQRARTDEPFSGAYSVFRRGLSVLAASWIVCATTACDPEALVKEKVPKPIQEFLTFSEPAPGKKPGAPAPPAGVVKILSPTAKGRHISGKPILFQAEAQLRDGKPVEGKALVWKVFKEKEQQGKVIGTGTRLEAKIDRGAYRVEAQMALPGGGNVVAKDTFRVAQALEGKVDYGGAGLAGVELILRSPDGAQELSKVMTDKYGGFVIEIPHDGPFLLAPRHEEMSFNPVSKEARASTKPQELVFQASRARILELLLTSSSGSKEPLQRICPGQEAYLKLGFTSENPIMRMEARLTPLQDPGERPLVLGEVIDRADVPNVSNESARQFLKVEIPSVAMQDPHPRSYGLSVKIHDDKGNTISFQAPEKLTLDVPHCVKERFEKGVSLHQEGKLDAAVEAYDAASKLPEKVQDSSSLGPSLAKTFFNRGMAHLELALATKADEPKQARYLGRALVDLAQAMKFTPRDPQVLLLRGLANFMKSNTQAAFEDVTACLALAQGTKGAYELRGRIYLAMKRNRNLSDAVDDFTQALVARPDDESLRKTRSAALDLDLRSDAEPGDATVDTSAIPLKELDKVIDLRDLRRS
ncbi:MAG: hypothetical protein FJ118_11495 [Deltaproteobacteria bacterium]|nr:hypothetical protein [Deltaproteobacteria bacterium]